MTFSAFAAQLRDKVADNSPLLPLEKRVMMGATRLLKEADLRLLLDNWKGRSRVLDEAAKQTFKRVELSPAVQAAAFNVAPADFLDYATEIDPKLQAKVTADTLRATLGNGIHNFSDFKHYDQGFLLHLVQAAGSSRASVNPSVFTTLADLLSREVFKPSKDMDMAMQALFEKHPEVALAGDDAYVVSFMDGRDGFNRILGAVNKSRLPGVNTAAFQERFGRLIDQAAGSLPVGPTPTNPVTVKSHYNKFRAWIQKMVKEAPTEPNRFSATRFAQGVVAAPEYLNYLLKHYHLVLTDGDDKVVDMRTQRRNLTAVAMFWIPVLQEPRLAVFLKGLKAPLLVRPKNKRVQNAFDALYELDAYITGAHDTYGEFTLEQAQHDLPADGAAPAATEGDDGYKPTAEDLPTDAPRVDTGAPAKETKPAPQGAGGELSKLYASAKANTAAVANDDLLAFVSEYDDGADDVALLTMSGDRKSMLQLWLDLTNTPASRQIGFNKIFNNSVANVGLGLFRFVSDGRYRVVMFAADDTALPQGGKTIGLLDSADLTQGMLDLIDGVMAEGKSVGLRNVNGGLLEDDGIALLADPDVAELLPATAAQFAGEPAEEPAEEPAATEPEVAEEPAVKLTTAQRKSFHTLMGNVSTALKELLDDAGNSVLESEDESQAFIDGSTDPKAFIDDVRAGSEDGAAGVFALFENADKIAAALAKLKDDVYAALVAETSDDVWAHIADLLATVGNADRLAPEGEPEEPTTTDVEQPEEPAAAEPETPEAAAGEATIDDTIASLTYALNNAVANIGDVSADEAAELKDLNAADLLDMLADDSLPAWVTEFGFEPTYAVTSDDLDTLAAEDPKGKRTAALKRALEDFLATAEAESLKPAPQPAPVRDNLPEGDGVEQVPTSAEEGAADLSNVFNAEPDAQDDGSLELTQDELDSVQAAAQAVVAAVADEGLDDDTINSYRELAESGNGESLMAAFDGETEADVYAVLEDQLGEEPLSAQMQDAFNAALCDAVLADLNPDGEVSEQAATPAAEFDYPQLAADFVSAYTSSLTPADKRQIMRLIEDDKPDAAAAVAEVFTDADDNTNGWYDDNLEGSTPEQLAQFDDHLLRECAKQFAEYSPTTEYLATTQKVVDAMDIDDLNALANLKDASAQLYYLLTDDNLVDAGLLDQLSDAAKDVIDRLHDEDGAGELTLPDELPHDDVNEQVHEQLVAKFAELNDHTPDLFEQPEGGEVTLDAAQEAAQAVMADHADYIANQTADFIKSAVANGYLSEDEVVANKFEPANGGTSRRASATRLQAKRLGDLDWNAKFYDSIYGILQTFYPEVEDALTEWSVEFDTLSDEDQDTALANALLNVLQGSAKTYPVDLEDDTAPAAAPAAAEPVAAPATVTDEDDGVSPIDSWDDFNDTAEDIAPLTVEPEETPAEPEADEGAADLSNVFNAEPDADLGDLMDDVLAPDEDEQATPTDGQSDEDLLWLPNVQIAADSVEDLRPVYEDVFRVLNSATESDRTDLASYLIAANPALEKTVNEVMAEDFAEPNWNGAAATTDEQGTPVEKVLGTMDAAAAADVTGISDDDLAATPGVAMLQVVDSLLAAKPSANVPATLRLSQIANDGEIDSTELANVIADSLLAGDRQPVYPTAWVNAAAKLKSNPQAKAALVSRLTSLLGDMPFSYFGE